MSFLQDVTALPGTTGFHGVISLGSPEKPIRDARSGGGFLAPLSQLLRHPARTINSVTEDVQNKAAARAFGKEDYENRRQILYHKLRIVMSTQRRSVLHPLTVCRLLLSKNGKALRSSWTSSKGTTSGNQTSSPTNTTWRWYKSGSVSWMKHEPTAT